MFVFVFDFVFGEIEQFVSERGPGAAAVGGAVEVVAVGEHHDVVPVITPFDVGDLSLDIKRFKIDLVDQGHLARARAEGVLL